MAEDMVLKERFCLNPRMISTSGLMVDKLQQIIMICKLKMKLKAQQVLNLGADYHNSRIKEIIFKIDKKKRKLFNCHFMVRRFFQAAIILMILDKIKFEIIQLNNNKI